MTDSNMVVADNIVVSMDYTLHSPEGELLDTSEGHGPLQFLQGSGGLIAGFAAAIYGMGIGEEKDFVVSPEEGYGEHNPDAKQVVPITAFPADFELEVGLPLQVRDEDGRIAQAFIAEIGEDSVLLDYNHPMAGQTLHFHVKVVDLRTASREELEHGHVHEPGHHHHH